MWRAIYGLDKDYYRYYIKGYTDANERLAGMYNAGVIQGKVFGVREYQEEQGDLHLRQYIFEVIKNQRYESKIEIHSGLEGSNSSPGI